MTFKPTRKASKIEKCIALNQKLIDSLVGAKQVKNRQQAVSQFVIEKLDYNLRYSNNLVVIFGSGDEKNNQEAIRAWISANYDSLLAQCHSDSPKEIANTALRHIVQLINEHVYDL